MARLSFEELQALLGLTQHAGGSADFGHGFFYGRSDGPTGRPPKCRSDLMAAGHFQKGGQMA